MFISPKMPVLVVDDSPDSLEIIKILLRKKGMNNVDVAFDGQSALIKIEEKLKDDKKYQLILADWNMPNLDGISFLKAVRSHALYSKVPFIMVTAENDKGKVLEAIQKGVDNYLIKPIIARVMYEKISETLQKIHKI